jgi:hypothetical protein
MTRERRLAIQMWEEIKEFIQESPELPVSDFKDTFCFEHGLSWGCSCWFCQYIKYCCDCPIQGCILSGGIPEGSNLYTLAVRGETLEERIEACDKIILALKGEYRWEEVSE